MKLFKIVVFWSLLMFPLSFSAHAAMIGDTAYIVTSMNYPHVAIDEAGFDAYMKAIASNDIPHGVTELYQKGKLFQVENNVKVTILDKKFLGGVKVRILEGKKKGASGWVAAEWIKDQPASSPARGFQLNCSKVKIADTYPVSIPEGFKKEQKTKYRVVDITEYSATIMDTNKIGNFSDCEIKMYPPIYFQEYSFQTYSPKAKKKWSSRTVRDEFDLLVYDGKKLAVIQKQK
ncbi:MAG: hypothetical protein A2V87_10255 [Deltaproteobacteria bacterium RBG_16_58_17]|nr:MAG: hypothetical protein A2V87_10255 [Deltaproteobacteria bacterium RBG_16_58_17]OHE16437.1 MAG: hypothetical protein A2X96_07765 [Syntrophobacterales bacterium GWC2_56_13]